MSNFFPQYTTDYISGVMSLRKPQKRSLEILAEIVDAVQLRKGMNLKAALGAVHAMYPTCSDFEREFLSLTFALATGVGKTRLMGAFIAYLYTHCDIKNYFVVAPNTTIYEKLKRELTNPSNSKYVFKGLGCFSTPPQVVTDTDYNDKNIQTTFYDSDVHLFVFNIDKFNKENANMKHIHEMLGASFYKYLSELPDLVLIMDESHHYRAERGAAALNDLHPLLGLELTATPLVNQGGKQVQFKNVVYEYPLSQAIADGYTRTPFAMTRADVDFFNFGDEALDKLMLTDGITYHERIKARLKAYAANHSTPEQPIRVVKPFMLVVCKDTDHAQQISDYIRSNEFRGGNYRNKTIVIHSKQRGAESDENMRRLLEVEKADNDVEIVIHVNRLKEGWDVDNLYTIVPLRTAASKILREQMVGRGLRLPYGERVADPEYQDINNVVLTAHNNFSDILEEAQKGDSIFKAGNVIKAEDIEPEESEDAQLSLDISEDKMLPTAYKQTGIQKTEQTDKLFRKASQKVQDKVQRHIRKNHAAKLTTEQAAQIAESIGAELAEDKDLGDVFKDNRDPLLAWTRQQTEETHRAAVSKFIPIPRIKVTDAGIEEYVFVDFDIDISEFNHVPVKNELLIVSLKSQEDRERIEGDHIDFDGYNPKKIILAELREKPEIDYERCSDLLFKLISQVCDHYERKHGENGMRNIVMMFKRDVANKIYMQMMQHFYCKEGFLQEEVIAPNDYNLSQHYEYQSRVGLYEEYTGDIRSVLFDGVKKGVFTTVKFQSRPELLFARVIESDKDVLNWLRPALKEFNITYNRGQSYQPDFVVETENLIYMVEIKGEDKLNDPDVLAKKDRGIEYCAVVSRWGKANGYKEWRYVFIPSKQVQPYSTFAQLAARFMVKSG